MKVLVVEDAEGMRKIVAAMLRNLGFDDVATAENGAAALEFLTATKIDLLVTNWNMPVMDGLELVKQLRRMPKYVSLPVLLFTSKAGREDLVVAMKAGVDGYLKKPFSPPQLRDQVAHLLGRRAEKRVARVMADLDPAVTDEKHPLIIIGVVDLVTATLDGAAAISGSSDDLKVGVALYSSSADISRKLKGLEDRVKALLVTSQLPGGGVTLARLASINAPSDMSVFLVREGDAELPDKIAKGLERLDVTPLQRDKLDAQALELLVTEHVAAKVHEGPPTELPTPEEIRRRLDVDIRLTVTLPVMPQVFQQIVTLSRDRDSDLQLWIDAIEADPLSRAQIIRRAHSPMYGFKGEIDQTDKAVILLGKDPVKELIVSEAVMRSFQGIQAQDFSVDDYWLHSVAVAFTARLLALPLEDDNRTPEQQKQFDSFELSDEALVKLRNMGLASRCAIEPEQDPFVAGMMHDIGKVALAHGYPGLYPLIEEELKNQKWNLPMSHGEETYAGGANHCLVGRILADSWKLGEDVSRVVEHHHDPAADRALESIMAVADFIGGGIVPFPKAAQYPLVRVLAGTPVADVAADLEKFISPAVLEGMKIELTDLVELAQFSSPSIRALSESIKESL